MSNWPSTSKQARGYGGAWTKLRLSILRRDNGLCQCALCQGGVLRITPANEVHHIVSKAEAKRMGWTQQQVDDPSNLTSLNSDCHKRVSLEERGYRVPTSTGLDGYPVASQASHAPQPPATACSKQREG